MGTVHTIRPDLVRMYGRVRDQAMVTAIEEHTSSDLPLLLRARQDHGEVHPRMTIRERAWQDGMATALDALIEARSETAPEPHAGDPHA
jgi:hypothetical protein